MPRAGYPPDGNASKNSSKNNSRQEISPPSAPNSPPKAAPVTNTGSRPQAAQQSAFSKPVGAQPAATAGSWDFGDLNGANEGAAKPNIQTNTDDFEF